MIRKYLSSIIAAALIVFAVTVFVLAFVTRGDFDLNADDPTGALPAINRSVEGGAAEEGIRERPASIDRPLPSPRISDMMPETDAAQPPEIDLGELGQETLDQSIQPEFAPLEPIVGAGESGEAPPDED